MSTAFSNIEAAVVAALLVAPAVAGGQVLRHRQRPVAAGLSSAVVVRLESANAVETALGAHDWTTVLAVECYAKAPPAADVAHTTADDLLAEVYARLAALSLPGQGVAQVAAQPAIDWQRDEDGSATVCAVLRLVVQHRTPAGTLNPWT